MVLFEGIPGVGKSTAAQRVTLEMRAVGVDARWVYEEERQHPVYLFDNEVSRGAVIEDLRRGRFESLITRAVARWAEFARMLAVGQQTVVADGCLFGYLTWSLFWADAPFGMIGGYVRSAGAALEAVEPLVIHLRPTDVEAAWRDLERSRGAEWTQEMVQRIERSPRARRLKLAGFSGLVRFWTDYLGICDQLFESLGAAKWCVEVDPRARVRANLEVLRLIDRLGLSPVGTYASDPGDQAVAIRRTSEATLAIQGLPGAWPEMELHPAGDRCFDLRGLPVTLRFDENGFYVQGPPLISGPRSARYARESSS